MKKLIMNVLGAIFLGIGAIGIIVPILPTTPFVILASICFVNNIKMTNWLMRNRYFSAYINNYRMKIGVPLGIKVKSICFIVIAFCISILLVDIFWVRCLLVIIALAVSVHIILLRKPANKNSQELLSSAKDYVKQELSGLNHSINPVPIIEKIESERLIMRRITREDTAEVAVMLQDLEVMYAWEHAFSDDEVTNWIEKRIANYERFGYDYMLAIDKDSGSVVGQIGLLNEIIDGANNIGVGYILKKEFWHKGYAVEGALSCTKYAFDNLYTNRVVLTVRIENISSIKVAKNLGMECIGEEIKHYNGKNMPHYIFELKKIAN